LPPIIKLRLASAEEKAAHELASKRAEYREGVKVVYLVDLAGRAWMHV